MTNTNTSPVTNDVWTVDVAGKDIDLPIVAIKPDFAISLMMVIDMGVKFGEFIGQKLAEKLGPLKPDVIVGPATLGIPVAIEVSRALGLDDYVVLQKSPKIHLGDAMEQTITSITSKGEQRILLDRRSVPLLKGRRVVVVDDVVASGSSLKGAIDLVRKAGGDVVGTGVILTEAHEWKDVMGKDAELIHNLGHIPQFIKKDGNWEPIPETL